MSDAMTFDYIDAKARDRQKVAEAIRDYLLGGGTITRREKDGTQRKYTEINGIRTEVVS